MSRKKLWPTPKAGQCGMTAKTSGRPIEKSTHLTTQVFVEAHGLSNDHNPPQSTFLQGDSPVSLSLSPGSAAARQTTATSGLRCAALLGYSSPGGSSLKTCLVSLLSKTDWSSTVCYLTWKAKVTKLGRLYFQLAPSTPRTEGTGCGLWRTPNTMDGLEAKSDAALEHEAEHRPGRAEPNNLRDQVAVRQGMRLWPTPREGKVTDENEESWRARNEAGKVATPPLTLAVKMWPTPNQRDYKGSPSDAWSNQASLPREVGGQLNPTWVEWLMGYPEGWTALDASEMPSSRRSRTKS
jgi:hypothetical protein